MYTHKTTSAFSAAYFGPTSVVAPCQVALSAPRLCDSVGMGRGARPRSALGLAAWRLVNANSLKPPPPVRSSEFFERAVNGWQLGSGGLSAPFRYALTIT